MRPSGSVPAAGALGQVPPGPDSSRGPPGSVTEGGRKSVWPSAFLLSAPTRSGRTRDGVGQAAGERPAGFSARRPPPGRAQHCPPAPEELPTPGAEAIHQWVSCIPAREQTLLLSHVLSCPGGGRFPGRGLQCSARGPGRFRPGVFCHGPALRLLTGGAWSHAGSCHTRECVPTSRSLVLSPVRSGASPGAGCRSGLPGHLPGLGLGLRARREPPALHPAGTVPALPQPGPSPGSPTPDPASPN